MYWKEFGAFVGRNIFTIVLAAVLAVTWPWTLIIIIPIAIVVIRIQMAIWKMRRMYQNTFQGGYQNANTNTKKSSERPGKITIVRTEQAEQRINDDVGEYVDFKEIKDKKTK